MKAKHLIATVFSAFLLSSWTLPEQQNFELRVGDGTSCLKSKTDIPVVLKIEKRFYKKNQVVVFANGMSLTSSGKPSTYIGKWRYIEFIGRVIGNGQKISVKLVLTDQKTGENTTLIEESYISCVDKE